MSLNTTTQAIRPANDNRRDLNNLSLSYARLLLRRKWHWLAAGLVIGIGGMLAYWQRAPKQFVSRAEILVVQKDTGLTAVSSQDSRSSAPEVSEDVLATHMKLIQSSRIVRNALENDHLDELPSIHSQLTTAVDTPVKYVMEHLSVTRGGEGQSKSAHVIGLAFRHTSEEDARLVVNALIGAYKRFLEATFQDVNLEAYQLIAEAEQKLQGELRTAEQEYQNFRRGSPLLYKGDESSNTYRTRYENAQVELTTVESKLAETKGRLAAVEKYLSVLDAANASDISRLTVIDEQAAPRIAMLLQVEQGEAASAAFLARQPERMETARLGIQTLSDLKAQAEVMRLTNGPKHPDVIQMDTRIKSLEATIKASNSQLDVPLAGTGFLKDAKKIVDAYVDFLRNDLVADELYRSELLTASQEAEKLARTMVNDELQDQFLRTEVERKQQMYDAIVGRLQEMNLAREYGGFINETIVEPEAGELVWPLLSVCLPVGILLGLLLGIGGAAVSTAREQAFRSPEAVKEMLDVPVLANVPTFRPSRGKGKEGGLKVHPAIIAYHAPVSVQSEAFRLLRTQLFCQQNDRGQVVQVTSPKQGDGKSTLITNLAVSVAQAGRRVLLIDCDLRRPSLSTLLGVPAEPRFASLLSGTIELAAAAMSTGVHNLDVITSALPAVSPELLESDAFGKLIESAKADYDVVFLDTPPLLPVADPCIIARHADAVILAIHIKRNTQSQAMWARQLLTDVGANLIGVVVNGVDVSSSYGYEYRAYGQSRYQYGDGSSQPPLSAAASLPVRRREPSRDTVDVS